MVGSQTSWLARMFGLWPAAGMACARQSRAQDTAGAIAPAGAIAAAGPDFEAAGPDFKAAGPDFEVARPDLEAAGPDLEAAGPDLEAAQTLVYRH